MSTYDLGDAVTVSTSVTDINGVPADATMTIAVTNPDGTAASPGSISHGGTGQYSVTFTPTQVGVYPFKWTATGAITQADSGQFNVADPAPPMYVSLAELKLQLTITDTTNDVLLLKALRSASRAVGKVCGGRKFGLSPVATPRIYPPIGNYDLEVDDIGSLAGLLVETGSGGTFATLASNLYEATPTTALVKGEPVTAFIDLNFSGVFWAAGVTPRVRVTARWGWPEIPEDISEATLILATRLYRRKGSPEGVAGFNDMGVVRMAKMDPDVQMLTQPYKRYSIC